MRIIRAWPQLHSFKFYSILLIVLGFCPFSNRIEKNEVEAVPPYNDALWYLFKWCIIINPRISQATESPLLAPPSKTNRCCANQGSVSFLARPLCSAHSAAFAQSKHTCAHHRRLTMEDRGFPSSFPEQTARTEGVPTAASQSRTSGVDRLLVSSHSSESV